MGLVKASLRLQSKKKSYFSPFVLIVSYFGFIGAVHSSELPIRQKNREFIVASSTTPVSLRPTDAWHQVHFLALNCFLANLVRNNSKGVTTAAVAKSWKISGGGKEYIFYLDEKYKFHDGSLIQAEDIAYSISIHLWPASKSIFGDILKGVIRGADRVKQGGSVDGVHVLRSNILKVILNKPYPPFLSIMATPGFGIIKRGTNGRRIPVGSGPMTATYDGDRQLWMFQEFGLFAGQMPKANRITLQNVPAPDLLRTIKGQEIDLALGYADYDYDGALLPNDYELHPLNSLGTLHLYANIERGSLRDEAFRSKFAQLIRYCIRRVGRESGRFVEPLSELLPRGLLPRKYHKVDEALLSPYDFRKLIGSNYKQKAQLRIFLRKEYLSPKVLESLRDGLKEAGLKVFIVQERIGDLLTHLEKKDYDLIMAGYFGLIADPDGFLDLFKEKNKLRTGIFPTTQLFNKINSIRFIPLVGARLEKYATVLNEFQAQNLIIPLYRLRFPTIVRKSVKIPDSNFRYGFEMNNLEWSITSEI